MHAYQYIPWVSSVVVESALVPVMLRQRIPKRFPYFFSYVVFDLIREVLVPLIAFLYSNPNVYFYGYWLSVSVEYVLTFLVILEIFAYIFNSHIKYSPKTVRFFVIFGLGLFIASVALILSRPPHEFIERHYPGSQPKRLVTRMRLVPFHMGIL
jgi:hypothetical protein